MERRRGDELTWLRTAGHPVLAESRERKLIFVRVRFLRLLFCQHSYGSYGRGEEVYFDRNELDDDYVIARSPIRSSSDRRKFERTIEKRQEFPFV